MAQLTAVHKRKKKGKLEPGPYYNDQRAVWLRHLVASYNMKRYAFGEMIGVHKNVFSMLCNGSRRVSDGLVYDIIAQLGVPPPQGMRPPMNVVPKGMDPKQLEQEVLVLRGLLKAQDTRIKDLEAKLKKAGKRS